MTRGFAGVRSLPGFCAGVVALGAVLLAGQIYAGDDIVFRSRVERVDVPPDAFVLLTPQDFSVPVPPGAFLEYDILLGEGNASFGGGICVVTARGSVIKEPTLKDAQGIDTHFARGAAALERAAKGSWYHRRIPLDTVSGSPATQVFAAASAGSASRAGENEVRYRDIRLTDRDGREIWRFAPVTGAVAYPLVLSAPYVKDVRLEAPLVSGGFEPESYLPTTDQPLGGVIRLKNFDPAQPRDVSYELHVRDRDKTTDIVAPVTGAVRLEPGAEAAVPVSLPPLARGDYRCELSLSSGQTTSVLKTAAITSLTPEEKSARKPPFTPGSFAMGAVSAAGGTPMQTLPFLREAGANYFQLRIDWSQLEPVKGQYDTSAILPYLDMARRCGMWLQIDLYSGYPAYTVPRWYWEEKMVSNTGRSNLPNNCSVAYWTEARQAGLRALGALLARYAQEPGVVAWNAWLGGNMDGFYMIRGTPQESGLQDYSPSSEAKFREYLQSRPGFSAEAAASRYGRPWEEIRQPAPRLDGVDLTPLWRDFSDYRLWSVGEVEAEAARLIRSRAPQAEPEYLYGGSLSSLGRNGNDFDAGVRNAMQYGGSMHHTASPGAENQLYLGTAKRKLGVPFSIETAGTPASPADHQHAMFELLSQDADAYTYIQSLVWGILPVPRPDYGFGELRPALERLDGALPAGRSIAVVFPYSDLIADPFQAVLPGPKRAEQFLRRMETVGYEVDVWTDRSQGVRWSDYPAVVLAFSTVLPESTVNEIARYVQGGGKVILLSSTGRNTPGEEGETWSLLKKLGVAQPAGAKSTVIGRPRAIFDGTLKGVETELTDWRPLPELPDGATVWAVNRSGKPAVASWPVQRGEVMVWGGLPDWQAPAAASPVSYGRSGSSAAAATVFPSPFDEVLRRFAAVEPPVRPVAPDVLCALRQKDGDYFLVLFNNSPREASAVLDVPLPAGRYHWMNLGSPFASGAAEASDGGGLKQSIALEPLQVAVIQFSPRPIAAPVLDFPPRARLVPPPGSASFGEALRGMFRSAGGDPLPAPADPVRGLPVGKGALLDVRFPAPGRYRLLLKTPPGRPAAGLETLKAGVMTGEPREMAGGTVSAFPVSAGSSTGSFRLTGDTEVQWVAVEPVWEPLSEIRVSPAMANPGPFPGQAFVAADDKSSALVKSRALPDGDGWKTVSPAADGQINLAAATGSPEGLALVSWQVDSPEARDFLLSLGADYGLKLWLNGEEVFDSTRTRREGPPTANEFRLPLRLNAGKNIFVAKVASGSQGWSVQVGSNGWLEPR